MPETDTDTSTDQAAEVEALQASVTKLEGALETKKGTIREIKGKLTALEALGDPTEAAQAIEFWNKHKDSDPDKADDRAKTLYEQKLTAAAEEHAAVKTKLETQILDLTSGRDVADAIAAAGGVKPGYSSLLANELAKHVAVKTINGKPQTVVLDTDGEPLTVKDSLAVLPVAEWVKETVKPQYPDMFLGANAGGGGSPPDGGDGGGGSNGKTISRSEWDALGVSNPKAQSKLAAEGVQLTDD